MIWQDWHLLGLRVCDVTFPGDTNYSQRPGRYIPSGRHDPPSKISPAMYPRGSRYPIIEDLGLKDHDCNGLWDLISS